jgi:hypothetical protein
MIYAVGYSCTLTIELQCYSSVTPSTKSSENLEKMKSETAETLEP